MSGDLIEALKENSRLKQALAEQKKSLYTKKEVDAIVDAILAGNSMEKNN